VSTRVWTALFQSLFLGWPPANWHGGRFVLLVMVKERDIRNERLAAVALYLRFTRMAASPLRPFLDHVPRVLDW